MGLTRRRLIVLVVALAAAYAAGGALWLVHQERKLRGERFADLASIGRLKAEAVAAWRRERLADAAVLTADPAMAADAGALSGDPRSPARARLLARLGSLREHYGYADVRLVAPDGTVLLGLAAADGVHRKAMPALAEALATRAPAFADLHRGDAQGEPHVAVVAPLVAGGAPGAPAPGAVVLVSNARDYLFPFIQTWPVPSASAEALLVERHSDAVLFLNDLRFRAGAALALEIPLDAVEVPAVQAVLGRAGQIEGLDYRGVRVMADVRPVPGSPWYLVAKVDRAEILAPLRAQALAALLAVLGLVALTGLGTAYIYKAQGKSAFVALYRAERERREAAEELRTTLRSIGDAVIATDAGGRVTLMNQVAEELTGWREAEALGRPLTEVFVIVNETSRRPVADPVAQVLAAGVVVGLANHTVLVARDGTERPIADSGAPVRDELGAISGVVLVFRDQTAERAAQRESGLLTDTIRAARDEIYLFDADTLRFRFVNDGALRNLGYTADEVARLTPVAIKPEFTPERFAELVGPLRRREVPLLVFETVHERKDGSRYPVEVHLQLLDVMGDRVYLAVIQDITAHRQADRAMQRLNRTLRTLSECNQSLVRATDEATLLADICRHVVEHGGYRMAWVGLALDDPGRTVRPVACSGVETGYLEAAGISWADSERGRGPTGTAIRERRTVIAGDLATAPGYAPWRDAAIARGYASSIAVPLLLDDSCLGALSLYAAEADAFDAEEVALLTELATDIAFGVRTLRDRAARATAERALAASEERLRLALSSANQGTFDLDVRTGEAIVSPEYASMIGYDPATFHETNAAWLERMHPDDLEAVAGVYRAYIAGELPEYRVEFRQRMRSGAWKWILAIGKVVERDAAGRPLRMLGTHTDITPQKVFEEALKEGEEKFSAAFHNSPIAMSMTATADGVYHDVNDAFLRDSGYSRDEVIGRTSADLGLFAHPEDRDRLIAEVLAHGRAYGVSCAIRTRDGTVGEALVSTCPISVGGTRYFLSASLDVSELKRAEDELRASRSALQAISDGAPVMICVVDERRRVLTGNLAFREACGWPDARLGSDRACDALGCINSLDHPDGCGFGPRCADCRLRAAVEDSLATGRPHRDVEWETTLVSHGEPRDAVLLASTSAFELAGSRRVVLCLVDITERRALEAQLRQAQRLEAVGTLAGGIAHDFNNLLQALLSSTQAARLQAADPALADSLAEIQAQVQRGASLTRQLLLFARQTPAHRALLDLAELVSEQSGMLRRLLPETITLTVAGDGGPVAVEADAGQLGQVLTNLVVNARDAMPDGGRIEISTTQRDGEAVLEVADTGAGIAPEVRSRIFDPFFTTKAQGQGTGLGLAVVWGIVRDHAGRVELDSETGHGTVFRVVLPAAAAAPVAPVAAASDALPIANGERVLLIEDEEGARVGLAELLEALRYRVTAVGSGEAALALAPEREFDLVLTDYRLPGATGLEVARTLRAARPGLAVVLMSGYAPGDVANDLFDDRELHFLQKPFDMAALAQALRAALG